MSSDISKQRDKLTKKLGDELGKTIYKALTKNKEYTDLNLTYFENKCVIEYMYAKVYELLYKDKYGDKKGENEK